MVRLWRSDRRQLHHYCDIIITLITIACGETQAMHKLEGENTCIQNAIITSQAVSRTVASQHCVVSINSQCQVNVKE